MIKKALNVYGRLIKSLYNLKESDVFMVDFSQNWFSLILNNNRFNLAIMSLTEVLSSIRVVVVPVLLAYSFESGQLSFVAVLWFGVILTDIIFQLGYGVGVRTVIRVKRSFQESAEMRIMSVDPIYNVMRSTGALSSQVKSGVAAIEGLVYGAFYHGISFIGLLAGSVFILWPYGWHVVLIGICFNVFLVGFSTCGYYLNTQALKKEYIGYRKKYFASFTENIIQMVFVRSLFGTQHALEKSSTAHYNYSLANYRVQRGSQFVRIISFSLQGVGLFVFSWYIINLNLSPVVAISMVFALFQLTSRLRMIGKVASDTMEQIIEVDEMYNTLAEYGDQSFPVA